MKKLRFLLSLTNDVNDYQVEQVNAARHAARRLNIDLDVTHADNDGIRQSQQLLAGVQTTVDTPPNAIIFEPAGSTSHPQVARAAASAGIGVAVLNHDADYLGALRREFQVPAFAITSDHKEVGRIQGQQLRALLPNGGTVLYIQGPAESPAARQRYAGTVETKPENASLRTLKAHWTEASARKAVYSWLQLPTSRQLQISAVCAQDDSMAMGARKAFEECADLRRDWRALPFLGCDGLPSTGQTWLHHNLLAATVYIPPNAGLAIEMMVKAIETAKLPSELTFTQAKSLPALDQLASRANSARAGSR